MFAEEVERVRYSNLQELRGIGRGKVEEDESTVKEGFDKREEYMKVTAIGQVTWCDQVTWRSQGDPGRASG